MKNNFNSQKEIFDALEDILWTKVEKNDDYISLFDILKINTVIENRKTIVYKRCQQYIDKNLELLGDEIKCFVLTEFDPNSKELQSVILTDGETISETTHIFSFTKPKRKIIITESDFDKETNNMIIKTLGKKLSLIYELIKQEYDLNLQCNFDIEILNSKFLAAVSLYRIGFYTASTSFDYNKFELSFYNGDYNLDCYISNFHYLYDKYFENLFKKVYVKKSDCPEYLQNYLKLNANTIPSAEEIDKIEEEKMIRNNPKIKVIDFHKKD